MTVAWVQVFPLITVVAATLGFGLGLALLAKEHHGSPCLQKAFTGLVLLALMLRGMRRSPISASTGG
jgi:hypothetical protein